MNLPPFIAVNLRLKIVSVVMGSLLWLFVMAGAEVEQSLQIPVLFANLDDSLTVVDKPPPFLEVLIKGDRLSLMILKKESLKLVLDMRGVTGGSLQFTNLEKAIPLDRRVRVTRVHPARIDISLARVDSEQSSR